MAIKLLCADKAAGLDSRLKDQGILSAAAAGLAQAACCRSRELTRCAASQISSTVLQVRPSMIDWTWQGLAT